MAQSKKRGGATAHRKRVMARNKSIKGEMKREQKMFQDAMMEQIEAIRKMSGETENDDLVTSESVKLNTDGFIQSAENI